MPRNILIPKEKLRIKAICNKGKGEKPSIYYFKDMDELQKLTKDVPELRCDIEYLPAHRAHIYEFAQTEDIKAGDYYLGPIGQDDGYTYSAVVCVVEEVLSPLLNSSYMLTGHINRYLVKVATKFNVANANAIQLTISMLNDDDIEVYTVVNKYIAVDTLLSMFKNASEYNERIGELMKHYVHAFCTMHDITAVCNQIVGELDKKEQEEIHCHCDDCKHEDHA